MQPRFTRCSWHFWFKLWEAIRDVKRALGSCPKDHGKDGEGMEFASLDLAENRSACRNL